MHVILVHGWLSTPQMHFFPWLKKELETRGYQVSAPQMPNPALPKRVEWLATLDDIVKTIDDPSDTILVGHSLGTITLLHYLNEIHAGEPFPKMVLCSGFGRPFTLPPLKDLPELPVSHPQLDLMRNKILNLPETFLRDWFTPALDYSHILKNVGMTTLVHSTDDPVVPYEESVYLSEQLDAKLITEQLGHIIEFRPHGRLTLPSALEAVLCLSCG